MAADTRARERERVQNTGRLRAREENEARKSSTDNSLSHTYTQHLEPTYTFCSFALNIYIGIIILCYLYKCVEGKGPNTAVIPSQCWNYNYNCHIVVIAISIAFFLIVIKHYLFLFKLYIIIIYIIGIINWNNGAIILST